MRIWDLCPRIFCGLYTLCVCVCGFVCVCGCGCVYFKWGTPSGLDGGLVSHQLCSCWKLPVVTGGMGSVLSHI